MVATRREPVLVDPDQRVTLHDVSWKELELLLEVYVLDAGAYRRVDRSPLLPELDPALVTRCLAEASTQSDAVRRFVAELRAG